MKKLIIAVAVIAALCCFGLSQARADDSDDITVTVSLAEIISVSLDPDVWDIGAIALEGTDGPEAFTVTVGNVKTDLDIKGTDGDGGWSLQTAIGTDAFAVLVDPTGETFQLTTVDQALETEVDAYTDNLTFELNYSAPDGDTKSADVDQDFTVTVTASKHTP